MSKLCDCRMKVIEELILQAPITGLMKKVDKRQGHKILEIPQGRLQVEAEYKLISLGALQVGSGEHQAWD